MDLGTGSGERIKPQKTDCGIIVLTIEVEVDENLAR
jgi:hypothetical protein